MSAAPNRYAHLISSPEEAEQWRQKYITTHNANVILERKLERLAREKHAARKQDGHDSYHCTTMTEAHAFAWSNNKQLPKKPPTAWHARDLNSNALW